jgi:hypothetical protein
MQMTNTKPEVGLWLADHTKGHLQRRVGQIVELLNNADGQSCRVVWVETATVTQDSISQGMGLAGSAHIERRVAPPSEVIAMSTIDANGWTLHATDTEAHAFRPT